MRTRYKIVDDNYAYFITSTIVNWIQVFNSEKYYSILINTIKFYQKQNNLEVFAYVFLPEHFHMVVRCKELEKTIQNISMYSAKLIISELKIDKRIEILEKLRTCKKEYKTNSYYQVWQEGFHPQVILDGKMYEQKISYLHFNPVKRGLVKEITDWKYSSAGFYFKDEESLIELSY